jgi:hypothetical protein
MGRLICDSGFDEDVTRLLYVARQAVFDRLAAEHPDRLADIDLADRIEHALIQLAHVGQRDVGALVRYALFSSCIQISSSGKPVARGQLSPSPRTRS